MLSFQAESVDVPSNSDLDYGEGWLSFIWPDPVYGCEGLTIDLDGHCSRKMPIRSGNGLPEFIALGRDRIGLRFPASLAEKLDLEEEIEIRFSIADREFCQLERTINYFNGVDRA